MNKLINKLLMGLTFASLTLACDSLPTEQTELLEQLDQENGGFETTTEFLESETYEIEDLEAEMDSLPDEADDALAPEIPQCETAETSLRDIVDLSLIHI